MDLVDLLKVNAHLIDMQCLPMCIHLHDCSRDLGCLLLLLFVVYHGDLLPLLQIQERIVYLLFHIVRQLPAGLRALFLGSNGFFQALEGIEWGELLCPSGGRDRLHDTLWKLRSLILQQSFYPAS